MMDLGSEEVERLERNVWTGMPTKHIYQRVKVISDLEKKTIEAMQEKYESHNNQNKLKETEKDKKKDDKNNLKKTANEKENTMTKKDTKEKEEKEVDAKKMAELFKIKLKVIKDTQTLNLQELYEE